MKGGGRRVIEVGEVSIKDEEEDSWYSHRPVATLSDRRLSS